MKVQNFAGFMKTRATGKVNEEDNFPAFDNMTSETMYGGTPNGFANEYDADRNAVDFGANPEEEETPELDETPEGEEGAEGEDEQEEVTLEDLKAMIDELTERVEKLEGGGEEEEGEEGAEGEGEEGAEGEAAEGEEGAEGEEAAK
jgi:hypothetical protein